MPNLLFRVLFLLFIFSGQAVSHARGRGTQSYLVDENGQVTASLGETGGDLLDAAAFVRYRYHEGRVTATPMDKPDEVLWKADAKPQLYGRKPAWRLVPDVLVILGEDSISGIDRASGKALYTTAADGFTRHPAFQKLAGEHGTPPAPTIFLLDTTAQDEENHAGKKNPTIAARLARFDLRAGKFLWKTDIITAAGVKIRPSEIDPSGFVQGQQMDDEFYFDVATGKALDKAPEETPGDTAPPPRRAQVTADKIKYHDAEGRVVWARMEPGEKCQPVRVRDTVLVATVTDRQTVTLLALDAKTGMERWRRQLPGGFFADQVTVELQPAKTGYLVNVEWTVLD